MAIERGERPSGRMEPADEQRAQQTEDGRFRSPGPDERRSLAGFLRWRWQRMVAGRAPRRPPAHALPLATPAFDHPRAPTTTLSVTWVGHATFLIQIGGLNLLTDPIWSDRASPVPWAGPRRIVRPGIPLDKLPPIDAILLSHDHYDHLDDRTVRRLSARFGDQLCWITPSGYSAWLARRGAHRVEELDWHGSTGLSHGDARVTVTALPAKHWAKRSLLRRSRRLWASFALHADGAGRLYFGGDSAYFAGYAGIGERFGPFDVSMLPIGAYEPRWFMAGAHMNPEEAVRAWRDLGGEGVLVGMHWGTFLLSDEPALEPPARVVAAWAAQGLDADRLVVLRHGETYRRDRGDAGDATGTGGDA